MTYVYLAGFVDVDGWGDITLSGVRSAVESARAEDPAAPITLVINSPGGDVMEGLAIYNYLKRAKVNVEISGMAASIASVIALAGQHVAIYDNSSLFVHHAWSYVGDANADEARTAADRMDAVDAMIKTVYAARGLSEEKIAEIMDGPDGQGSLVSAASALELGLVDEVLDPALALAACMKARKSHAAPADTASAVNSSHSSYSSHTQAQNKEPAQMAIEDPNLTDPNADSCNEPENQDPETQDPETQDPETGDPEDTAASDELKDLKAQLEATMAKLAAAESKLEAQKRFRSVVASAAQTAEAAPLTFPEAVKKEGFAKACELHPQLRADYMRAEMRKGSIR